MQYNDPSNVLLSFKLIQINQTHVNLIHFTINNLSLAF